MAKIDDAMQTLNKMSIELVHIRQQIIETNAFLRSLREQEDTLYKKIAFYYENNIKGITRDGEVIPMAEGDEI